jgi:hypothetical protein
MSKLTVYMTLLCAIVLFALSSVPASARSAGEAPRASVRCEDGAAAPSADGAKVAFLRSLVQQQGAKPGTSSSRRPLPTKMPRTECTSDGPITTCCGSCGCCTWTGDGNGPNCKSWC